jgi:hypothetical protein
MKRNGELYTIAGEKIAAIEEEGKVSVGPCELEAVILPDYSLKLANKTSVSNKAEAHFQAVKHLANELSHRKMDLQHMSSSVKKLMEDAEKGEDNGAEIAELLAVQGNHTRIIADLEAKRVPVTYEKHITGKFVIMRPGHFLSVSWFDKPVVWCPCEEFNFVREEVATASAEMPARVDARMDTADS